MTKDRETNRSGRRRAMLYVLAAVPLGVFACGNVVFLMAAASRPIFELIGRAYAFNTIAMPVLFAASGLLGLTASRRFRGDKSLRWVSRAWLVAAAACLGVRVWATHVEPGWLAVRRVTISSPKVRQGIRILHISDIQSDAVGRHEVRAFAKMRALEPDLVVFTGDLLQPLPPATTQTELPKIAALFRTLTPRLGIYGVLGDVDHRIAGASQADLGGLKVLKDEGVAIDAGGATIRLYGLSCGQSRGGKYVTDKIANWLADAPPGDFTILMGHAPDFVLSVRDLPIDLCLAGHTHGGQVRVPFYGPVVTLSEVPREWVRGYREVGRTRLNVSAGVGSEHCAGIPAIRLNCPTEMTLIEIVPRAGQ